MVSTTHVATKKLCYDSLDGILLNPEKRFALYLKITDSYIINFNTSGLERCPSLDYGLGDSQKTVTSVATMEATQQKENK